MFKIGDKIGVLKAVYIGFAKFTIVKNDTIVATTKTLIKTKNGERLKKREHSYIVGDDEIKKAETELNSAYNLALNKYRLINALIEYEKDIFSYSKEKLEKYAHDYITNLTKLLETLEG